MSAAFFIGPVAVASPLVLAPLAGFTDCAFRLLCRENGASLCFSEMVSTHGLSYRSATTERLLATHHNDHPFFVQLFGSDPAFYADATAFLTTLPIEGIDINMGCPVKKVVKKGAGAALMRSPALAEKIIAIVTKNTPLPVTVKFRSGWDSDHINAVEFARMAEGAGAAAVTVHARTWKQAFGGRADWNIIAAVKKAVSIPVIGNGDVTCHEMGQQMLQESGCDGVMIGRGALGNPWIFSAAGRPRTVHGRAAVLLRHLHLILATAQQDFPPDRLLAAVRGHAARYFSGLAGAAELRKKIFSSRSFEELLTLVTHLC